MLLNVSVGNGSAALDVGADFGAGFDADFGADLALAVTFGAARLGAELLDLGEVAAGI